MSMRAGTIELALATSLDWVGMKMETRNGDDVLFAYSVSPRELRQLDLAEDRIKRSMQHLTRKRNVSAQEGNDYGSGENLAEEELEKDDSTTSKGASGGCEDTTNADTLAMQLAKQKQQLQQIQRKKKYFLSILETLTCKPRNAYIHLKSTTDGAQGEALRGIVDAVDVVVRSTDISQITWDELPKAEYERLHEKKRNMGELPS